MIEEQRLLDCRDGIKNAGKTKNEVQHGGVASRREMPDLTDDIVILVLLYYILRALYRRTRS